jgi:hypothetical protein
MIGQKGVSAQKGSEGKKESGTESAKQALTDSLVKLEKM